jgi:uncharacterized protein YkwD
MIRALLSRIALVGLAALLASCAERPDAPAPMADGGFYRSMAQPGAAVDAAQARDMISLYRRNKGLAPLALDPALQRVAETQAEAMARANRLSHETQGELAARLSAAGVKTSASAENISAGYHTLPEAFSGWRQSRPHDSNMLDPRMKRMGIATAYAPGAKYKVFWALVVAD